MKLSIIALLGLMAFDSVRGEETTAIESGTMGMVSTSKKPSDACIHDFKGLNVAIMAAPEGSDKPANIVLCKRKIEFPSEIAVGDKAYKMVCPEDSACSLDG